MMAGLASSGAFAPAGNKDRLQSWTLAALLGLATLALYWSATSHDFVDYDDQRYVTQNLEVQRGLTARGIIWAFTHPVSGNWHPVTMLSHMLDCQLYGLRPWGHHLTSILLHASNAVLVFLLLHRLTGALWRSAIVAALFAWHPLRVESVAWVAERKDVLSSLFFLLTLMAYARYGEDRRREDGRQGSAVGGRRSEAGLPSGRVFPSSIFHLRSSIFYLLALFCFALGLLSKPMLVTLPLVLLLLDYWPLNRWQTGRLWPLLLEKLPFFILAAAASAVALAVQKQAGAVEALARWPLPLRCENAVISYCRYLGNIVWPSELAVFYPPPSHWPLGWVLVAGLFLGALTILCWLVRRRHPFLLVGWFWFVGSLVPVIGLVQVGRQAMADRYTYLPSIGLLLLVVWGAHELSRNWRRQALGLGLAGVAAVILLATVTRQQLTYWQNSETLFRHALKVTSDNDVARVNLGVALLEEKQTNAAMCQFQTALALKPACFEAYENLGNIAVQEGGTEAAISNYQAAVRFKPGYVEAHNNLGNLFALQGRTNAAIGEFQEAIRLNPDYAEAHYNLASLLGRNGQVDAAISQYQTVLRITPEDAETHFKLGNLLAKQGRADEAIAQFQEALRFRPDYPEAHYNLGHAFLKQGRLDEAIGQWQMVIHRWPNSAPAHFYLGTALSLKGRDSEATQQFEEVLRLNPDDAVAHDKLGIVLGDHGRLDDAIREFQAAVRLQPNYAEASNNLARALQLKNARRPNP